MRKPKATSGAGALAPVPALVKQLIFRLRFYGTHSTFPVADLSPRRLGRSGLLRWNRRPLGGAELELRVWPLKSARAHLAIIWAWTSGS